MPGPTTLLSAILLASSLRLPFVAGEGGSTIAEQAGLHPAAVACAGVDTSRAMTMLSNFEANGAGWAQLKAAQASMDGAIQAIGVYQEDLELDPGNTELQTALADARAELNAARAALQTARQQAVQAAAGWMGEDTAAMLIGCSGAQIRGLPPEFGALHLDQGQARQLRLALMSEVRAERRGEAVPDHARALLQRARSDRAVINAKAHLSVNLPGVRAAWDQAR